MKRSVILGICIAAIAAAGIAYQQGLLPVGQLDKALAWTADPSKNKSGEHNPAKSPAGATTADNSKDDARSAPPVTVSEASPRNFSETVFVTGSLIAREEILVLAEVEGLRIIEIRAEEGDRVEKGQILAKLETETLSSQLAQNTALLNRADAAIAQARSQIVEAEANVIEAEASLKRAKPLQSSGYLSESLFDQREALAKTARARLVASRDGLALTEADKARIKAERRELEWRLMKTDIKAPETGIVSNRTARLGAIAAAVGEPLFRIIENGEIEFDAEIPEARIGTVKVGQETKIDVAGGNDVTGKVRLISPAIDPMTRLGRARIFIGDNPSLRIGSFAKGSIETASGSGLAVPAPAILYSASGPSVQRIVDGRVQTVSVETGLVAGGYVEIRKGLSAGDIVVAKAGTFLRDGDAVRPVRPNSVVSEVK